jgi:hypothetical protein
MRPYEPPAITAVGKLSQITLGQFFSRCDGHSGNGGNMGVGGGGCEDKTGGPS